MWERRSLIFLIIGILIMLVAGCQPASLPEGTPFPSSAAKPSPTSAPVDPTEIPAPAAEDWNIDLEWPESVYLGESDSIRLTLRPLEDGYILEADFDEHTTETTEVTLLRRDDYLLYATASLDAVGFRFSPAEPQSWEVLPGEEVTWQWSVTPESTGKQHLAVSLEVQWRPLDDAKDPRTFAVYSKVLEVQVISFLGTTKSQALAISVFGLFLGGGISLATLIRKPRRRKSHLHIMQPHAGLVLEPSSGIALLEEEQTLLKTQFKSYTRLAVSREFYSGYSGARTFMALPIRSDGRSDANTIVKISNRQSVEREYNNYLTYVKNTLPAVTARIEEPPVSISRGTLASLKYTFVGQPGTSPVSLRQALLKEKDSSLLIKLFETFGPNWWMQRRTGTFRIGQEYDRKLPSHYFIEPCEGQGSILDGEKPPHAYDFQAGEVVRVQNFPEIEQRANGTSLSLIGHAYPGYPGLRLRWLNASYKNGDTGRVVDTRITFLRKIIASFGHQVSTGPLGILLPLLEETLTAAYSIIHGDLNLENILVGPGGLVWLIDFAETREGHPLYDFAQLYAEIIAHVLRRETASPEQYLAAYQRNEYDLLNVLSSLAQRCLFDPGEPREFDIAVFLSCLGMLKYPNLDAVSKEMLYLTAVSLSGQL